MPSLYPGSNLAWVINVVADKIAHEIEMFGSEFEKYPEMIESTSASAVDKAKATAVKYQFQLLESSGVPCAEIKKFTDLLYWVEYFTPIARADCTRFGARIDWRRSFITTNLNPCYDSFVRWQMNKLRAMNKIKFGERYTIYSAKDGQPCMDHDRTVGEGVHPQEYTAIKIEVKEWSDAAQKALPEDIRKMKVYLVAATLFPETMYGQTHCFVGSDINYGLYAIKDDIILVCTQRSIRNMAYQGVTGVRGEIKELGTTSLNLLLSPNHQC